MKYFCIHLKKPDSDFGSQYPIYFDNCKEWCSLRLQNIGKRPHKIIYIVPFSQMVCFIPYATPFFEKPWKSNYHGLPFTHFNYQDIIKKIRARKKFPFFYVDAKYDFEKLTWYTG